MNGVQTRFKCKLDVKRCKRFVFPPSSLLPRSNALKTKAIRYFQTDQTLTRIVSSPLLTYYLGGINLKDLLEYNFKDKDYIRYIRHKTRNRKKGANEIVFSLQPEAKEIINRYLSKEGKLRFGKYVSYKQIYSLIFRNINKVAEMSGISKKVTYYSARKTFAQHGYNLGIQIEKIEYCIGHSMKSNRPIFNYIKIMQEHADKVFREILNQLL